MKVVKSVFDRLKVLESQFMEFYERMFDYDGVHGLNISVMTLLFTFHSTFDITNLESEDYTIDKTLRFSNQVSVRSNDVDTKHCCKLFHNGKIHVTGSKSVSDGILVVQEMLTKLYKKEYVLVDFRIEMLNMDFQVNKELLLPSIYENALHDKIHAVYNTTRYPGLKIPTPSGTVLMFSSGAVILTGCKCVSDVEFMINRIYSMLGRHAYGKSHTSKTNKRKRRVVHYKYGYASPLVDSVFGVCQRIRSC